MKKQILWTFILLFLILGNNSYAQNVDISAPSKRVSKLFSSEKLLSIKLSFSIKNIKKNTNDSTYLASDLFYLKEDKTWDTLEVGLRTRGHYRLDHCYFPPIKIKIKKSVSKSTLFQGNKKLKLVLPCLTNDSKNDYIIKEFMAYKLFEIISPVHFKTRLVEIEFTDIKNKKRKTYMLKGFLIEDDKKVAKRLDGKVLDRHINPLGQDAIASIRNAFFQYMIGNVDYSTLVQHNEKLLYLDKTFVPLPYDFDMSGLVNANYAVVSVINDKPLVSSVTDRLYRGFKRDTKLIEQVRQEFIANKSQILDRVDSLAPFFDSQNQFTNAKKFINSFFDIMMDEKRYEKKIMQNLRVK